MKKGLIFIGEANTGKSRMAQQIKKYYGDKAVYLDGRQFNPNGIDFYFRDCTSDTKVVIIDDLVKVDYLMCFLEIASSGKIEVNIQGKKPFEIQIDKLILVLSSNIKKEDLPNGFSFNRNFSVLGFREDESVEFLISLILNK